ncbi:lysosome-associated membrane glycoprotein 1-like [Vespula pensylvanica]|uniref:Lysosome-associated membrane glycoprotein 5 n=1 Tax=Vespula pensylvanica TaxID=30213 RepID=A0A834K8X3_VESPE|nr:lysosome-associated membrane glycoprotein 1-like [Vespula pensylvanica]KAF7402055.1 hypothetical protein H0235_015391 [Vespula pensylvanica]
MKLQFLYGILLTIAIIQAEGAGSTSNVVDNPNVRIVVRKESRGNEGRSLNDNGDHSIDEEFNQTFENDDLREEDSNKDNNSTSISEQTSKRSSTETTMLSTKQTPSTKETSSTKETPPIKTLPTIASPEEYPYQVKGENGTCILSKMTISLNVTYNNTNLENSNEILSIPTHEITTDGYCSEPVSVMQLTWPVPFLEEKTNNITFYLKKANSTFSVFEILLLIHLDEWNFPNALDADILQTTGPNLTLFAASTINGKYICNNETKVKTETVEISITDVILIAFNTDNDVSSRSEENCVPKLNIAELSNFDIESIGLITIPIAAILMICTIACIIWLQKRNSCLHSEYKK